MLNAIRRKKCRDRADWMKPQIVKDAIPQLERELSSPPKDLKEIWLSPVTDPYQPIEDKTRLTRGILQLLIKRNIPVRILTKSIGILQDAKLIIKNRPLISVGFTITSLNEDTRRKYEPNASPVWDRIRVLEHFHKHGVKTWCSVEPILDDHPTAILNTLKDDVDWWVFGKDNYTHRWLPYQKIRDDITMWFRKHGMMNYLIKKELREA